MSDYLRPHVPGAAVFFTVCLAERGSDLLIRDVERLREAFRVTMGERPFAIEAMVVLPDHLHCVWRLPPGDADFSTRWSAIKARFAMGLPAGRLRRSHWVRREKGIWQRRFWEHHIRDDADYAAHVRYCWINPVKHGLVKRPTEWRYSSLHRDIARGMAAPEWGGVVPDGEFGE